MLIHSFLGNETGSSVGAAVEYFRRLVATRTDGSESDLESTMHRLLKQLQQVNSQMQAWVSSGGSEIFAHTLNRHREILQDLTQLTH